MTEIMSSDVGNEMDSLFMVGHLVETYLEAFKVCVLSFKAMQSNV